MNKKQKGLDLSLFPIELELTYYDKTNSVISISRDYELWKEIRKLNKHKVEREFFFDLPSICGCNLLSRGELYYVLAGELSKAKLLDDTSMRNKAIWKYIEALPPERKIVLYWY